MRVMNEHSEFGEPATSETVEGRPVPEFDPSTASESGESPGGPEPVAALAADAADAQEPPSEADTTQMIERTPEFSPESRPESNPAASNLAASNPTEYPDSIDVGKKTRAPRVPKAPAKPTEAGSVTAIVERVVRLSSLDEAHVAALARLLNISLPDDQVARLTRLTAISLGPVGNNAAEALAIVLGLESANLIHVGVQLGRLAPAALPDVYRCAHALSGSSAPALPKGDPAVFAVADVLATLTTEDFTLARSLQESLQ